MPRPAFALALLARPTSITDSRDGFDPVGDKLSAVRIMGLAAMDAVQWNFSSGGILVTAGGANVAKAADNRLSIV